MSDSPSKRARERRKSQKRREKKTRRANLPTDEDQDEVAARYVDRPVDDDEAPQEKAEGQGS